jgi:adenosylmethionine-8-amino-7-oxononanoate aminotransferase
VTSDRALVPDWLSTGWPHIWLPYTQMKTAALPLPVVATKGTRLWLADGRELIDGIASWWTACHGYNHPHIVAALRRQLEIMPHVMFGGLNHEPALTLARRLAALLPDGLTRVFFADSGSVAVEVALKIALQYWINQGAHGRTRFVAFRHAYHGDTLGAMSVCDPIDSMHAQFRGHLPEQIAVDLPRTRSELDGFEALLARRRDEIAGVIVEPLVQGAGGMKFHGAETLAAIHAAAARHGVLFIADEVFTGFGRTGQMFACAEAGVVPDIVCVGKALTGGAIGLAATVATERVFAAFLADDPAKALMHGPTYMANPLACAAANASLDLFEREPRLKQVAAIEAHLREALQPCRRLPGVADVRAKGAIGVVEIARMRDLDWLKRRFVEKGVWLRPFGNIVYTTPPFVIEPQDLVRITDAMVTVLTEWSRR